MSHLDASTVSQGYKRYCQSPRVKANPPSFEDYRTKFGSRFNGQEQATETTPDAREVVIIDGQMFTLTRLPDGVAQGATTSVGAVKQPQDARFTPRNPDAPASGKRLWLLNSAGVTIPQGCTDGMAQTLINEHGYENLKSAASA